MNIPNSGLVQQVHETLTSGLWVQHASAESLYLTLMFLALLTPHGSPYLLGGMGGKWAGGGRKRDGRKNYGWNVK